MPGDLATEDRSFFPHALLEERVTDPVHQRRATESRGRVFHRVAGTDVVDDLRAGMLQERRFTKQGRDEITGDEFAVPVDEEAAVRVAIPGDADVSLVAHYALDDVAAVLLDQRIGLMIREGAVHVET